MPERCLAQVVLSGSDPNDRVEIVYEIIEGRRQGERLTEFMQLLHRDKAVESRDRNRIARLCGALGVDRPESIEDLQFIPLVLEVSCTEDGSLSVVEYLSPNKANRRARM